MRPARLIASSIVTFRIVPWLLALSACACTALIESRLEDGPPVHCDEHNVRLSRELDPDSCRTVVGERFTVTLDDYSPQDRAVVQFSPALSPHLVLAELESPVEPGGQVTFAMPDLPLPAGSRIRVQIQGRFAPSAFSGHFQVEWTNLLAALDERGLVSIWHAGAMAGEAPRLFGRIPSGGTDGPDGELVVSPAGRHLLVGAPAHPGRGTSPTEAPGEGRTLRLLSVFGRKSLATLDDTGGIDAVAFQNATASSPARLAWVRRDPQTGRWRLVSGELEEGRLGPAVTIAGAPDFILPPRLISSFGDLLVIPRDHLVNWKAGETAEPGGTFWLITPGLAAVALTCEAALGQSGEGRVPLDLLPVDHPDLGRIAVVSCAAVLTSEDAPPVYSAVARWVRWEASFPSVQDAWAPFEVSTPRIPEGWSLPSKPGPGSLALLRTIPSTKDVAGGAILVDPAGTVPVDVDVAALGPTGHRVLLIDEATLMIYAPDTWREATATPDGPALLVGKRGAQGWSFGLHARGLRFALPWSEDLLVLANPHNMIQSTLDDFTAGLPGALFTPSACVHAVLKPSYR